MDIAETLKKVHDSKEFKLYQKNNPNAYLVHIFFMTGNGIDVGYYNAETDLLAAFNTKNEVKKVVEEKPFKQSTTIHLLDLKKVKLSMDDAFDIAIQCQKEKYKNELVNKEIVILQELEGCGIIYNITFITESFKTLNIKIDAQTKNIVSENIAPLIGF